MAESAADRRKYARVETGDVISIAPIDLPERLAVSRNVSHGGIRFEAVGCEIQFGDVFRITFNIADHTVVAVGKVVWATDVDPITLDVGLQFIEIDPLALRLIEESEQLDQPAGA